MVPSGSSSYPFPFLSNYHLFLQVGKKDSYPQRRSKRIKKVVLSLPRLVGKLQVFFNRTTFLPSSCRQRFQEPQLFFSSLCSPHFFIRPVSHRHISMASFYSAASPLIRTLARFKFRLPTTTTTCSSNIGSARILHSIRHQDDLEKRLVTYCSKIPSPRAAIQQTTGNIHAHKAALSGRICPVNLCEQRPICSRL